MEPEHQEQLRRELTSCVVRLIDVTETFLSVQLITPAQVLKQASALWDIRRDIEHVCYELEGEIHEPEGEKR